MKANHHHIQRLAGTPPPHNNGATGWRVRYYDGEGARHTKTFADRKHGGRAAALDAAITFRDQALAEAERVRSDRIAAQFVPALTPHQRRQLRARMIDADCRGYNRHFRVRIKTAAAELAQVYFPFRQYGSPRRAFAAALRFRDRIERLPISQRQELLT